MTRRGRQKEKNGLCRGGKNKIYAAACKGADNRGVSFVEVIVSMLILAIAVIPLLGCFMMSLRVNAKSRQAMSATIVAQNVMECVKEYANAKVVTANVGEDMKSYLPASYAAGFESSGDGFTLSSVQEGMNDYYVEVKYDRTAFESGDKSGINDRKIPDLTTLDADSTVVVCPSGVVDGRLENAAKDYFFNEWVSMQWVLNADTEGYTGPNEEQRAQTRSDIETSMTGELTLEVSGTALAPRVSASLLYRYQGMTYPAYSFESSAGLGTLENVYVFYDPLRVADDGTGSCRIEDTVWIKNDSGLSWNLFFAVQESAECLGGRSADKLSGPVFAMDWMYNGEPIGLYCSTQLQTDQRVSVNGGVQMPGFHKLEDRQALFETGSYARMQKVTVNVYRQGTGDLLASMETDILQ